MDTQAGQILQNARRRILVPAVSGHARSGCQATSKLHGQPLCERGLADLALANRFLDSTAYRRCRNACRVSQRTFQQLCIQPSAKPDAKTPTHILDWWRWVQSKEDKDCALPAGFDGQQLHSSHCQGLGLRPCGGHGSSGARQLPRRRTMLAAACSLQKPVDLLRLEASASRRAANRGRRKKLDLCNCRLQQLTSHGLCTGRRLENFQLVAGMSVTCIQPA
mmetsp:Transcript_6042/g.11553  ORF Transcript_6042/g.11553 Transcript_6042/m.11553 type:complete len:221 (-) Transcript_6042:137-799(-)